MQDLKYFNYIHKLFSRLSNSEPFIFKYYDNKPKIQKITNNGHSIQLTIVENTEPKMQPKVKIVTGF